MQQQRDLTHGGVIFFDQAKTLLTSYIIYFVPKLTNRLPLPLTFTVQMHIFALLRINPLLPLYGLAHF